MDDAIRAFAAEARSYCLLIEGSDFPNSWTFAQACLAQLLRLYQQALLLPEVQPETTALLNGIEHEPWQHMREHIAQRLARDYYWEIFEPLESEKPEPVAGSLSDDLADIWRDLKPTIGADNQAAIGDIVWSWRFSFETHWGHHAAEAIFALHALCFGQFADASRPQNASKG